MLVTPVYKVRKSVMRKYLDKSFLVPEFCYMIEEMCFIALFRSKIVLCTYLFLVIFGATYIVPLFAVRTSRVGTIFQPDDSESYLGSFKWAF